MALRKIVYEDDEILTKKSREVVSFDKRLHTLLDDMAETLAGAEGAGLAAVQVGILRRVVIVDVGEGVIELVNPVITAAEGEQDGPEGCLSVPGRYGKVCRPMKVTLEACDRNGKKFTRTGEGLLARAFCHEVDHLDGKMYMDLVSEWLDPEEDDG